MFNSSTVGERPTVIVVPSYINRVLARNKLKFSEYLNFEKLRASLSQEDFRFWLALAEATKIAGTNLSNNLIGGVLEKGRGPNFGKGFDTHLDPSYYASSADIEEAIAYLNQSNAMTENFYSFHREGSTIFVVVEEGFMLKLEDPSSKLEFLKTYLKKLSEIVPIHMLAQDRLHLQYVSLVTSL